MVPELIALSESRSLVSEGDSWLFYGASRRKAAPDHNHKHDTLPTIRPLHPPFQTLFPSQSLSCWTRVCLLFAVLHKAGVRQAHSSAPCPVSRASLLSATPAPPAALGGQQRSRRRGCAAMSHPEIEDSSAALSVSSWDFLK